MKTLLLSLLAAFLIVCPHLRAQDSLQPASATTSPGVTSALTASATSPRNTSATSKTTSAETSVVFNWTTDVFGPLARLLGIVLILGLFLWWLELPALLKRDAWTDRTVLAFIIIFTFCASALINVENRILSVLKDITLIVIGFYFGSGKGNDAPKSPTPTPNTPSKPA